MTNKIELDFKNILSELKCKNLKLCFLKNRVLFIEDSQKNLYQIETYRVGSYLDDLIKNGIVVMFHRVKKSIRENIGDKGKEIWEISDVEGFIKKQSLY